MNDFIEVTDFYSGYTHLIRVSEICAIVRAYDEDRAVAVSHIHFYKYTELLVKETTDEIYKLIASLGLPQQIVPASYKD